MKRRTQLAIACGVVLLVLGASLGVRRYVLPGGQRSAIAHAPIDGERAGSSPAAASSPPAAADGVAPARGPVTIDPRRQQLIGVETVAVERKPLDATVRVPGVVRYDETKLSDVNLKVDGWIRTLYVNATGQPVEKGQPLFALYSPDLVNAQNEYLLALAARDTVEQSPVADARRRAEELAAAARERLTRWDLGDDDIQTLEREKRPLETLTFRSPSSGVVTEKQAVQGMHVTPGESLYKLADLSTVWVEADVYEAQLAAVRVGSPASVSLDAYPGQPVTGRVVYVYPYLDENTRTNKVRFELPNRNGRLKPGMYVTAELALGRGQGLVVPTDAVLDSGTDQIVFVAKGNGLFEPRHVKVGVRLGATTQILEGVAEGERVATGAAFFLDSESQLRASLQAYQGAAGRSPSETPAHQPFDIAFRTQPDPPKTGDNQIDVVISDPAGRPVDDAEVSVQLFMPAMPAMGMPATKSEARLRSIGGGSYRGTIQVTTKGQWQVTIAVSRSGQALASKQLTLVAQ